MPESERLASVYCREEGLVSHVPMAYPDYRDLRAAQRSFSELTAYALRPLALESAASEQVVLGEVVDPNYFAVLRVRPALGRSFATGGSDAPAEAAVAVLSHGAWQRRFGGDPGVIGGTVRVNGRPFTVIGVAPPSFRGLLSGVAPELWVPTGAFALFGPAEDPLGEARDRLENRGSRWVNVVGRLAPGVSVEAARREAEAVSRRLAGEYPDTNRERVFDVLPTASVRVLPGVDRVMAAAMGVLLGIAGLVLLIACANGAGMMLARIAARRRELAVRLALGAPRWRVLRLLAAEGLALAMLGAAVGLGVGAASNAALGSLRLPLDVSPDLGLSLDGRVVGWTLALTLLATLGVAWLPALRATRPAYASALRNRSGLGTLGRAGRLLVVAQVALSVTLLAGASLLLRSLANAHEVDPGFEVEGVAVLQTDPGLRGASPERAAAMYARLQEEAAALPGVESIAYASHLPLSFELRTTEVAADAAASAEEPWPEVDAARVGPGYFALLRMPLLRGRDFTAADRGEAGPVAIVNQTFVARFLGDRPALGHLLRVGRGEPETVRIVGVVADGKYRTLGEDPRPFLYQPLAQSGETSWTLLARARDPAATLERLRGALREIDEEVPVRALRTLEDATSAALLLPRAGATLFGLTGLLGLTLAAAGVYGLVAQLAAQRLPEFGVRLALGASRGELFRLVVWEGTKLALVGAAAGVGLALLAAPALRGVLLGVSPLDPLTFGTVPALLLLVVVLASALPARRAARTDPRHVLSGD